MIRIICSPGRCCVSQERVHARWLERDEEEEAMAARALLRLLLSSLFFEACCTLVVSSILSIYITHAHLYIDTQGCEKSDGVQGNIPLVSTACTRPSAARWVSPVCVCAPPQGCQQLLISGFFLAAWQPLEFGAGARKGDGNWICASLSLARTTKAFLLCIADNYVSPTLLRLGMSLLWLNALKWKIRVFPKWIYVAILSPFAALYMFFKGEKAESVFFTEELHFT